jgi:hypothetical protein
MFWQKSRFHRGAHEGLAIILYTIGRVYDAG